MLGVVALHVAGTATAGGVDACFDGWGREAAFGGIVDCWADVACLVLALEGNGVEREWGGWTGSTPAVRGFGG